MDQLTKEFNLLGLACLAVAIVVVVGFTRKFITFFLPSWVPVQNLVLGPDNIKVYSTIYKSEVAHFYNEIGVFLLPYAWAALLAVPKVTFIFGNVGTYIGRFFLSVFVATFSASIFRIVKKLLPKAYGVEMPMMDDDDPFSPQKPRSPSTPTGA